MILEYQPNRMEKFINYIKNFFIAIIKKLDKDDKLTQVQQLAFDIYNICLYDDNNIRYLNTIDTYKRYIVSKKFIIDKTINTFIILETEKITIVNHQYRYDIDIPRKTSEKMIKMFDSKARSDREVMENEIFGNITSSLSLVLVDFKNRLEEEITIAPRNT